MSKLNVSEQSYISGPQAERQRQPLEIINEVPKEAPNEAPIRNLQHGQFKPHIHFVGPAGLEMKGQNFWQRLITFGLRPGGLSPVFYTNDNESILNLAGLQRLNLHTLQMKLVNKAAELIRYETASEAQMDDINDAMTKYVAALRDWDYMLDSKKKAGNEIWRDPFIITTEKTLDMCLMRDAEIILTYNQAGKAPLDLSRPNLPGDGRGSFNRGLKTKMFWKRFLAAISGGIALLSPMLLMVLHKSLATTLATACVSVILFALAVAYFLEESLGTVVSIVAAYTAVIVVFVGTSS